MKTVLRVLFENALKVSLGAPLLLGCGIDTTAFDRPQCSNGHLSLDGMSPASPVDSVDLLYQVYRPVQNPVLASSSGVRCATAQDQPSCLRSLETLMLESGFRSACSELCLRYGLVTTSGDAVTSVDSMAKLRDFLGPIDTPQEALLLAFAEGYDLSCNDPQHGAVRRVAGGFEVVATSGFACGRGTSLKQHLLGVSAAGEVTDERQVVLEVGRPNCTIGRRPPGLHLAPPVGASALGWHFANATQLESAAVHAFVRLFHELDAHGAPHHLRVRAVVGAAEEVCHARSTLALARRFGGHPRRPVVSATATRSLAELSTDNAVEGCVRETFGALLAHRQARRAKDPWIAAELATIAEEETRHAELSWELDAWAKRRLGRSDRQRLVEARRAAARTLIAEQCIPVAPVLEVAAGLPSAEEAAELAQGLTEELERLA